MLKILTRSWWAEVLEGVAAVIFGILAFIFPRTALVVLIALFGAFALVDGIFSIVEAAEGAAHHQSWIWPALRGIAGVAAGIITFVFPGITAIALLYVIAAWAIVTGIFEIVAAIQLRREVTNEWLLILAGALSVLFGIVLVLFGPGPGLLAVVWLIATYAILVGALRIALGFRLHSLQEHAAPPLPRRA
ncbi:MAG TPA: HdeD family acid-resistance protein [Ktedonobacterales bacterium]